MLCAFLLARIKRMALGTNFNLQIFTQCRASLKGITTTARHAYFIIIRMYPTAHNLQTSLFIALTEWLVHKNINAHSSEIIHNNQDLFCLEVNYMSNSAHKTVWSEGRVHVRGAVSIAHAVHKERKLALIKIWSIRKPWLRNLLDTTINLPGFGSAW